MTAALTTDVAAAAAALAAGAVIAIPTDTVYGLACDPRNPAAVEGVYAVKQRPAQLELTLLAASMSQLEPLVEFDRTARGLARGWPGGLSLVLRRRSAGLWVPRSGTTLSVRVPDHPLLTGLLVCTGPLATTSANRHGEPPAVTAAEALSSLGDQVALVLDGGPAAGTASTIIDCTTTPPRVLRHGPVAAESLLEPLEDSP